MNPYSLRATTILVTPTKIGTAFAIEFSLSDPSTNSSCISSANTLYPKTVTSITAALSMVHVVRASLESLLDALKYWASTVDNPSLSFKYEEARAYADLELCKMAEQWPTDNFRLERGSHGFRMNHPDGCIALDEKRNEARIIQFQLMDYERSLSIFEDIKPWLGGMLNECAPDKWDMNKLQSDYDLMAKWLHFYRRVGTDTPIEQATDLSALKLPTFSPDELVKDAVLMAINENPGDTGELTRRTLSVLLEFIPQGKLHEVIRRLHAYDPRLAKAIEQQVSSS